MEQLAKDINNKIKQSNLYKEHLFYKNQVESNEEIIKQKEVLEDLKKKICKDKNENDVEEYYKVEKEYKSNLVVKEYFKSKEELYNLLKDIVDILSLN